jgi:hypothetical protein
LNEFSHIAKEYEKLKLSLWIDYEFDRDDYTISDIHAQLVELLETVIISPNEDDVIEDAIELLTDYEWPPFKIIEKNMNCIPMNLMPNVRYLLNRDTE